ncbi:hypothetical protein PENTCL1PPCAC_21872, partial [Pristionchus entomophagus]
EEEEEEDDSDAEEKLWLEKYLADRRIRRDSRSIIFYKEKSYSSDCLRRIAQNTSIGKLEIELTGSEEFHREIYNMIKEFDIGKLYLNYDDGKNELLKEMMVD